MKEIKVLMEALESGSSIKVVYKLGSQPGHAREILPIRIENNELIARCLSSDTKKTFYINKLKLLTDEQYCKRPKWDRDFSSLTDFEIFEFRKQKQHKTVLLYFVLIGFIALIATLFILR